MIIFDKWKDYELLDTGDGDKLERWGNIILRRPDPQIIWPINSNNKDWKRIDAQYHRSKTGGGHWESISSIPERWTIDYGNLNGKINNIHLKYRQMHIEYKYSVRL